MHAYLVLLFAYHIIGAGPGFWMGVANFFFKVIKKYNKLKLNPDINIFDNLLTKS